MGLDPKKYPHGGVKVIATYLDGDELVTVQTINQPRHLHKKPEITELSRRKVRT